jgi:hypothetical protein
MSTSLLCFPNIACQMIKDKNPLLDNDTIVSILEKMYSYHAIFLNKKCNSNKFNSKNVSNCFTFDNFRKYYDKAIKSIT